MEFSIGKKHFPPWKIQKNDFAPSENFSCYGPEANPLPGDTHTYGGAALLMDRLFTRNPY